jgi:heme/copper-type cytochrome/quinol oxidase subunit 2
MKTFALVTLAVVLLGGPIALAGQETLWTGTRPNDYFDLLLLKESTERWVAIVGLVVIGVLAVVVYARTSHVRSESREEESRTSSTRSSSATTWISIPRAQVLTENQRLQNLKDVFQTIAQGQAALWTPK